MNSLNTCLFIDLKAIRRFVLYDAALVVLNIVVISNFLCCINYLNLVYSYYNLSTRVQIEKHVCVLTINGVADVSGLPSFSSIPHRNIIIFDTRKTLHLKELSAKLLKNIFEGQW